MNPVFVDTSVLIAAEDVGQPALHHAVLAWLDVLWHSRTGRTSNQALVEFYEQVTTAETPLPQGDARAAIRRYQTWTPWQTDAATLETAGPCKRAMPCRLRTAWPWPARSTAAANGCLTLHLPHGAQYGGVTMVHPLQQAPQAGSQGA